MKRFIRLVCLLVVFATLAAVPAYAQAENARGSAYICAYRSYCTQVTSTSVAVFFHILGTGIMDEIGTTEIKLQYSSDQVNWTTAQTFTKADYPIMTAMEDFSHAAEVIGTVPAGKYYRAYVEFYSAKDNGFGERYYYTEII